MPSSHPTFSHIDMLDVSVRDASFVTAELVSKNALAHIQNALEMVEATPQLQQIAAETLAHVRKFASTLTITARKVEIDAARGATRQQIAALRDAMGQAPRSAIAVALRI